MKLRLFIISMLLIYLLLILLPVILWYVKEPTELNISIIDKTVPDESYQEHLGISWILTNQKVVNGEGEFYKLEEDYYGYHPYDSMGDQTYASIKNLDLIYVADTYGVYDEAISDGSSSYIYGGLNIFEWNRIMYSKGNDATLVVEYGSLGIPTDDLTRSVMEENLSVDYTGWFGRYFSNLQRDVPDIIKDNYFNQFNKEWNYIGEGIVLANELKGELVVLTEEDFNEKISFELTTIGEEHYKGIKNSTYNNWFEIVEPIDKNYIEAIFYIDTSQSGKEKLAQFDIPNQFPAIVYNKERKIYYFAGDFADQDENYWAKWVLPKKFNQLIAYFENRDQFYLESYEPLIQTILNEVSVK